MWWLKASPIISTALLTLNFITIHLVPKWNVARPSVFDLACQRHIRLRHLLPSLIAISSYSVPLSCLSLCIWMIMFENAASTFSLSYHVSRAPTLCWKWECTVKRNPNISVNKIGWKPPDGYHALEYIWWEHPLKKGTLFFFFFKHCIEFTWSS